MEDPSKNRARVQQAMRDYMQQEGFRLTKQRVAIIEAAFGSHEHFTAESLWERAAQIEPSVSRPTVYRTIKVMVQSGYLRPLDIGRDHQHYDPNFTTRPSHSHIICANCDEVIEFDDPCLEIREGALIKELGFNLKEAAFKVVANCEELRSTGKCARRDDKE